MKELNEYWQLREPLEDESNFVTVDWFEVAKMIAKINSRSTIEVKKHDDIMCPQCNTHHIDKDEWAKRLHRKHLCEECGHIWQPFEGYTFGVESIKRSEL